VNVLLIFLDGVGIGTKDPERNPIVRAELPALRSLLGGAVFHRGSARRSSNLAELSPVNATLGVGGLPQSGTGQAAIFTGVNAPKRIGRHFGPYPTSELRPVIEEFNVFRRVLELGKKAVFANTFPRQFFEYTKSGTRRLTVTSMAAMMAGVPLLDAEALKRNDKVPILGRARAATLIGRALVSRAGGVEKILVALLGPERGKKAYEPLAWIERTQRNVASVKDDALKGAAGKAREVSKKGLDALRDTLKGKPEPSK